MTRFLLVCLAGAVGTGLRYLTTLGAERFLGVSFPWGTLTVNVVGSFLIAFVATIAVMTSALSDTARVTIISGFLGGLTTYSSFNQDTLRFVQARAYGTAAIYLLATLLACFAAGALGLTFARR